jgi:hypothetical protein
VKCARHIDILKVDVNKRAITWLLAALLAIAANAAVPLPRTQTGSGGSEIVWIAQDRAEQRVWIQSRWVDTSEESSVQFNFEPPAKPLYFATSLYQRPPPFLR